jgi:hypothetical protein
MDARKFRVQTGIQIPFRIFFRKKRLEIEKQLNMPHVNDINIIKYIFQ